MSKIFVDQVDPKTGTSLTLGTSGDTVNIPSGVTLANAGTVTGLPASAISSGTIATARLGSGTASSSTFLRGDQTYAAAGGTNSGPFHVYKATLSIANATETLITGWSEIFDVDSWFASDKYTPQEAGKYVFFFSMRADNIGATARMQIGLKKNGTGIGTAIGETNIVSSSYPSVSQSYIVDMNGSSDYIEMRAYQNQGGSAAFFDLFLMGYKLA